MKLFFTFLFMACCVFGQSTRNLNAGFRASRIPESYPNNQFPSESYWVNTGNAIAAKFTGAQPAGIWIVSLYQSSGITELNFPSTGGSIPYVNFTDTDENESYLARFDSAGLKLWLEVEPGAASMDTLISIVLNRYKNHSCVAGFGIDVEWYQAQADSNGEKVTDAEASLWEQKVKAVNPNYTLFLKHYDQLWMPPTYRGSILFVDDSQEFPSLASMVSEFSSWGQKFSPNMAAFQYGYALDSVWWKQYTDPMYTIGSALLSSIPNCSGLFWVDFTINRIFPITVVAGTLIKPKDFDLFQNYPNPFNPVTRINYSIPQRSFVSITVYDVLGRQTAEIINEEKPAGSYSIDFNAGKYSSGIYFYTLRSGEYSQTKKMIILK
jgi:hypothetical protein